MGDLKTPWDASKQAFTGTDTSGAGVVSSGSDPNADGGQDGGAGLKTFWDGPEKPITDATSQAESSNSVSGLPSLPNRFEPSESINDIPDLTDRSPGTIDKQ